MNDAKKKTDGKRVALTDLLYALKREEGGYEVMFNNGVNIGALEMDVDGYYKYWPNQREGYWDSPPLRAIADLIDHINADWDAQVRKNCDV